MIQLPQINRQHLYFAGGILLLLALFFAVNRATSWYDNYQHSKVVEQLKADRQKDVERGDFFEAKATAAEADKAKLQITLELAGKDGKIAAEKVQNAEIQFEKDMQSVNADMDICRRYAELRARLKLQPAPCE
jgi:hypothetical protein